MTTLRSPIGHLPDIPEPVCFPDQRPDASSTRRWQHHYSARLRITDSTIVCASVFFAQYIRFGDSPNTSATRAC
jgi:hypothetical protein